MKDLLMAAAILAFIVLGTWLMCKSAHAEGMSLNLGGVSHHLRNDSLHNDVNVGLGLQYDFSAELGVAGGVYRNSEWKDSVYVYVRYQPFRVGPVNLGTVGGLVTGYRVSPVLPATLLCASVPIGPVTLSLVGLPNVGHAVDGFVSLQLGVKLP